MIAKFLTFFGLVSLATALVVPTAPLSKVVYAEPEAPAQYEFSYSVEDAQTGDVKQQQESRSGDAVQGSYSLVQPDGVRRIVEYTADDRQGFNAVVRYEGNPVQRVPVTKIGYAPAPVTKFAYAPAPLTKIAYAPAPIAKVAYSAPITKVAYSPAPLAYAAPPRVTYAQAPPAISYATAPVTKLAYGAPVAKVAYSENLGRVTFSSPIVSYQH